MRRFVIDWAHVGSVSTIAPPVVTVLNASPRSMQLVQLHLYSNGDRTSSTTVKHRFGDWELLKKFQNGALSHVLPHKPNNSGEGAGGRRSGGRRGKGGGGRWRILWLMDMGFETVRGVVVVVGVTEATMHATERC